MEASHKHNNGENDSTNFCNVWIHSSSHHSPEESEQHKNPRLNTKSTKQIMGDVPYFKTNHYISLSFLNVPNKSQSLQHDILHNFAPICTNYSCILRQYDKDLLAKAVTDLWK